jgi:acetylornithine/succinyldiaminopimelate/putrescine aminotransferase
MDSAAATSPPSAAGTRQSAHALWRRFVNPDYVALLEAFDFGRRFTWAQGTRLRDDEGREYTDFLAGFGVHNVGHNHPRLVARLREALASGEPSMLNVDAPLAAGRLAERLNALTHPDLCRAAFASSGAEAVEIAIKAARAATRRPGLLACAGAYHGLTTGALALQQEPAHTRAFGPLLPGAEQVPFGDTAALEEACARLQPAAFFVEPVQGEGGIRAAPPGYLEAAGRICRARGCLLVVDEIQTGLGRTGADFATDFARVAPDILLVGKALSGGLVPVAAALMNARTWSRAFSGPERCHGCASTFAAGRLAMVAGLETLNVLREEDLAARSRAEGGWFLDRLQDLARRHPVIRNVRGCGLFMGIEFQPASGWLSKVVPRWARQQLFTQVAAAVLLRDHGLLTQACGRAPAVLRIEPPLVITRAEIDGFVAALDQVLAGYPSPGSAIAAAFRKTILKGDL